MNVEALIKRCLEGEKQFTKSSRDEWQSEKLPKYNPDFVPWGKGQGLGGDGGVDECRKAFLFSLGKERKVKYTVKLIIIQHRVPKLLNTTLIHYKQACDWQLYDSQSCYRECYRE